jgi:hypothetical protein
LMPLFLCYENFFKLGDFLASNLTVAIWQHALI